jgi:hypothetical protein
MRGFPVSIVGSKLGEIRTHFEVKLTKSARIGPRAEIRVKIRHRENEQKQEKRFFCVMQTTLLHLRSVPRARQGTPFLEWREEPPVAV